MTSSCGAVDFSVGATLAGWRGAVTVLAADFHRESCSRAQNLNGEKPSHCSSHGRLFILNLLLTIFS